MFSDRGAVVAAFDALDTALDAVAGLSFGALTTPERFALLAWNGCAGACRWPSMR